jgi:hypothetical protein
VATADFFIGVAKALLDVVRPLEQAVQSADGFESLLLRYGWQTPTDQAYINEIQSIFALTNDIEQAVVLIEDIVAQDDFTFDDATKALQLTIDIVQKIRALATSPPPNALPPPLNDGNFWPAFAGDLAQDLFVGYLQVFLPTVYAPLHLLGIVDEEKVPANGAPGRIDYVRNTVRWDRLGKMFSDPNSLMVDVYGWGSVFLHDSFVRRLQRVMLAFGLPASLYRPLHALQSDYYADGNRFLPAVSELRAPFFIESESDVGYAEIGLTLLPIPALGDKNGAPVGFLVGPYLHGSASVDVPLGGPVVLQLHGGLDADAPVGLEIRPTGVAIRFSPNGTTIDAGMALAAAPPQPWILLGTPNSHRLELTDFRLGVDVVGAITDPEVKLTIKTTKLSVVVQFEDGDGFLQKIFGTEPQVLFVDGTLIWSSRTGVQFSGDAGISLALPINLSIAGVIQIPMLYILVQVSSGKHIELDVAVDAGVTVGPIAGSVTKLGIRLMLTPKAKNEPAGAFGDLDLGFGFKPPTGIGVSLDAGPISGGGFIEFDEDAGRYAGVLALSLYSIQIKAIGLLDTKLPNGQHGYSFLIIISVEFSPIQLGFGFTLNGVGGLCGINRDFVTEALQAGLRAHSLDHILFPKDPVKNAPAIISDLRAIFPPAEGRYVFGPMIEIGWGGGLNLLTAELGVILAIPSPVIIAILGQLNVMLPNPDAAIVELHLDVLGIIDFGKKLFSLDATLHDSRVVIFTIYGDMAMRLSWGDHPNFALSVGGLNPHFQPPDGFPSLKRLTISLSASDDFRLSIQSYFAITSNSFQFGCKAELFAGVSAFNVYGWLVFDALFIFQPFSFLIEFNAGLALRSGTDTLLGITVDGALSGPTPWHLVGNAHVTIIFFEISVHVEVTWGDDHQVVAPLTDAWPPLLEAIQNLQNWSGSLPSSIPAPVTIAVPKAEAKKIYVDPNGVLTLRERVLPLNQPLTKFGEAVPGPQTTFSLDQVTLGGQSIPFTLVKDKFAPAQFEQMSDQDKLSRPSFEDRVAGFSVGDGQLAFGRQFGLDLEYTDVYVDDLATTPRKLLRYRPSLARHAAWSLTSGAAQSAMRVAVLGKFAPASDTPQLMTMDPELYVVASADDLTQRADISEPVTKGEAFQAMRAYLANNPSEHGRLQVVPLHELAA